MEIARAGERNPSHSEEDLFLNLFHERSGSATSARDTHPNYPIQNFIATCFSLDTQEVFVVTRQRQKHLLSQETFFVAEKSLLA